MLLSVESYSCHLKGVSIFNDVSFHVDQGGLVCIEGGSGRGKSSLLFGIRGIAPDTKMYGGTLLFNGRPPDEAARQRMGLVLQNPHSQMISTLVREELMFGMPASDGHYPEQYRQAVAFLGLAPLLDQPVRTLSSGQKHLVAIAAAGILLPSLLMLDEPFLYLDPDNIQRVLAYLHHLRKQGIGVVITSHPGIVPREAVDAVISLTSREPVPADGPQAALQKVTCKPFPERQLVLEKVGYGYGEKRLALGISRTISTGREMWIEGRNGAGKTTLLNILSQARTPDAGRLIIQGDAGPCRVMTITQNPDRHFFESSVEKELTGAIAGKQKDLARVAAVQEEMETLLHHAGLARKKKIPPFHLSFGQKIHLVAVQAVLLEPDFIFVDDILGFLDSRERENLLDFLRTAMARKGCGLVFTSSRGRYARGRDIDRLDLEDHAPSRLGATAPGTGPTPPGYAAPVWKKILKAFKTPAFDYVAGASPLHRASPLVKMAISMLCWFLIYKTGVPGYPALAGALFLYYMLTGLGSGHFWADSRFFLLQALVFTLFMPLFRWDLAAAGEGALAGVRVWLFFVPVMVMMRTTTVGEWMALFSRILSREKNMAVGIAFGLLPCITADAREILHLQGQKGLLPVKRDLFYPSRLGVGLKSVFIPLLILMEDISDLAGVSVRLKGMEK